MLSPDGKWFWTGEEWIPAPPASDVIPTAEATASALGAATATPYEGPTPPARRWVLLLVAMILLAGGAAGLAAFLDRPQLEPDVEVATNSNDSTSEEPNQNQYVKLSFSMATCYTNHVCIIQGGLKDVSNGPLTMDLRAFTMQQGGNTYAVRSGLQGWGYAETTVNPGDTAYFDVKLHLEPSLPRAGWTLAWTDPNGDVLTTGLDLPATDRESGGSL